MVFTVYHEFSPETPHMKHGKHTHRLSGADFPKNTNPRSPSMWDNSSSIMLPSGKRLHSY